jgi:hypothetical protein
MGPGEQSAGPCGGGAVRQPLDQHAISHIRDNVPRRRSNPQRLYHAFIAAVPSAPLVLVPLFALLLRVFHVRSGQVYLEHPVVALATRSYA